MLRSVFSYLSLCKLFYNNSEDYWILLFSAYYILKYLFILKERQGKEIQRSSSCRFKLLIHSPNTHLGEAKARRQESNPGLPHMWQGTNYLFHLKELQKEIWEGRHSRERKNFHLLVQLHKWPQYPDLGWSKARSQELLPSLSCGCRSPRT